MTNDVSHPTEAFLLIASPQLLLVKVLTLISFQNYPPAAEPGRGHHGPSMGGAHPAHAPHAPHAPHPAHAPHPPHAGISEAEFEEVMSRNRTVSSSAIARAVSDAAAGEYASAIETLVTAISLIKQSKVILITSLTVRRIPQGLYSSH